MSDPSDIELMLRFRDGDEGAFATLVTRYQDELLNLFRRMGVHHHAEDLVQDTFVKVYRWRERYSPRASFRTFLYTVARNVGADHWRRTARKEPDAAAERPEEIPAPGDEGVAREMRLDVQTALEGLPPKLREVVVLSTYQGLTYEEIGRLLGIPEGTVKSRMFLAMRQLKEALRVD